MCTVIFGWRVFPEAPIVVAANRDERLERQASEPRVWSAETDILAPRDEEAGGTWMGVNEHGVFAGLTNRWVDADLSGTRSRGLLVQDVLSATNVEAGISTVHRALENDSYEGFNLLIADSNRAVLLEHDGGLTSRELQPGIHVVTNSGADGDYEFPDFRKSVSRTQARNADGVRETMQPKPDESASDWLERGKRVLGNHDNGVCIHGDGYGTVSTSLIAIDGDGVIEYQFVDGPPCRTEARPVDNQV